MRGFVRHRDDEVELMARAVLNDLDSAGVLADMLDERDPPTCCYLSGRRAPSRGTLLRRRWKVWQRDREGYRIVRTNYYAEGEYEARSVLADAQFRDYIKSRFIVPIRTR